MSELKIERDISNQFVIWTIVGIIFTGFIIRFFYFPFDVPLSLDASTYLSYAYEITRYGEFPNQFLLANNGWPTFLVIFFGVLENTDYQNFVDIQRVVTITISIITIFPMYFLCRKFFPKFISLIGAGILILEPRVIGNSILGITEPLFILLTTTSLVVFFSEKKWIYLSFALLACATIVRYEAFLLVIPFSIMLFFKFKHDNQKVLKYLLCIAIFIIILFPMMMIKMETMGFDGILSHISSGVNAVSKHAVQGIPAAPDDVDFPGERNEFRLHNFLGFGFSNMILSLGIIQIPIFVFFFPIGVFFLFRKDTIKKINYKHVTLILFVIVLGIIILYLHGRGIQDVRYYLVLYPIIILICSFGIEKIRSKINDKILLISIFVFITIITIAYLEYDKIDYDLERESFEITSKSLEIANKINGGGLHGGYITTAAMIENWPDLERPSEVKDRKISPFIKCVSEKENIQWMVLRMEDTPYVCKNGAESLEEFIKQNMDNGLDHIVVDEIERKPDFIQDIFYNEKTYPFLEKVFDSKNMGYDYHVKIFKINFEKFDGEF